jgi:hypothetical protein
MRPLPVLALAAALAFSLPLRPDANAGDEDRIAALEARVEQLEGRVARLEGGSPAAKPELTAAHRASLKAVGRAIQDVLATGKTVEDPFDMVSAEHARSFHEVAAMLERGDLGAPWPRADGAEEPALTTAVRAVTAGLRMQHVQGRLARPSHMKEVVRQASDFTTALEMAAFPQVRKAYDALMVLLR